VCREFAKSLNQAVVGKMSKKTAAATLGVSRQMLEVYLNGEAMPGSDVIMRAMKAWGIPFRFRGRQISVSQLSKPTAVAASAPEQLSLPLEDAIRHLGPEDLGVSISKKGMDRVELQVSIKFAR
jgi:transcriptional regulator with XRE-family HTH domain